MRACSRSSCGHSGVPSTSTKNSPAHFKARVRSSGTVIFSLSVKFLFNGLELQGLSIDRPTHRGPKLFGHVFDFAVYAGRSRKNPHFPGQCRIARGSAGGEVRSSGLRDPSPGREFDSLYVRGDPHRFLAWEQSQEKPLVAFALDHMPIG